MNINFFKEINKMHYSNKIIAFFLCIMFLISSTSCDLNKDTSISENSDSNYLVVVDTTNLCLEKVSYSFSSPNTDERVDEIINSLKNYKGNKFVSPFPENVELVRWEYSDKQVTLYFGSEYYNLAVTDEVLCRSAIVESLCQIAGVNAVSFYVDETELTISNKVIGRMTLDTFLYDVDEQDNYTNVTLFFPDENMDSLTKIIRSVNINGMYTDEQTVLMELLKGPSSSEKLSRAIPEGTELINIVTKDKVCYVNLSSDFTDYLDNVPEEITIYSIVNTLTTISGISSVLITVDGKTLDYYKTLPCNDFLTYNYDLVNENE